MKHLFLCALFACSFTTSAFDVVRGNVETPIPKDVCDVTEVMFDGNTTLYSQCKDTVDSIVTVKIDSERSFADLLEFLHHYQPDGSFADYDVTDALLDGVLVAITPFDDSMVVTEGSSAIRFCLSDRTVYLVNDNLRWVVITVLSK